MTNGEKQDLDWLQDIRKSAISMYAGNGGENLKNLQLEEMQIILTTGKHLEDQIFKKEGLSLRAQEISSGAEVANEIAMVIRESRKSRRIEEGNADIVDVFSVVEHELPTLEDLGVALVPGEDKWDDSKITYDEIMFNGGKNEK